MGEEKCLEIINSLLGKQLVAALSHMHTVFCPDFNAFMPNRHVPLELTVLVRKPIPQINILDIMLAADRAYDGIYVLNARIKVFPSHHRR